jgi:hypothetical protein
MNEDSLFDSLLYQALSSPSGILVWCSDAHRVRQKLYRRRTLLKDPSLSILSFRPTGGELFDEGQLAICKTDISPEGPLQDDPEFTLEDLLK